MKTYFTSNIKSSVDFNEFIKKVHRYAENGFCILHPFQIKEIENQRFKKDWKICKKLINESDKFIYLKHPNNLSGLIGKEAGYAKAKGIPVLIIETTNQNYEIEIDAFLNKI